MILETPIAILSENQKFKNRINQIIYTDLQKLFNTQSTIQKQLFLYSLIDEKQKRLGLIHIVLTKLENNLNSQLNITHFDLFLKDFEGSDQRSDLKRIYEKSTGLLKFHAGLELTSNQISSLTNYEKEILTILIIQYGNIDEKIDYFLKLDIQERNIVSELFQSKLNVVNQFIH